MGRSSAEQARKNRANIVAQASRLFRGKGVGAVPVAEIMAAAGMTVGGFYRHFGSKEALVDEACALSFRQAGEAWQDMPGPAAIVRHYFARRPPDRTCPILAYADHACHEQPGAAARQIYAAGAGALRAAFPGDDEGQVIFAAMIGAQLLAEGSGHADWATGLQETVLRRAEALSGR